MIKDYRFVPFEEREPVEEEFDDFSEELILHKKFMKRSDGKRLLVAS